MQWIFEDDHSRPVFTPEEHISGKFPDGKVPGLPRRAVLFCLSRGLPLLRERFGAEVLLEELPGFITPTPVLVVPGYGDVCFVDGGRGAPQAASVPETLHAMGVEEMLVVGLCGAFGQQVQVGDLLMPEKILSEEGASRHYFARREIAVPRGIWTREQAAEALGQEIKGENTVTTDAVYRQTFYKEAQWRAQGYVGVDMEASAIVNVCEYYGLKSTVLFMASDKHPLTPEGPRWRWGGEDYALYKRKQERFLTGCVELALK